MVRQHHAWDMVTVVASPAVDCGTPAAWHAAGCLLRNERHPFLQQQQQLVSISSQKCLAVAIATPSSRQW